MLLGGEHICQGCYYSLSPIYKPMLLENAKGYVIYGKNAKINELLQAFLQENNASIGPALFSYAHLFFSLRFHNYPVIPLPEKNVESSFQPAEKVFAPFQMRIMNVLQTKIVEKEDIVTQKLVIGAKCKIPNKAMLFSCKNDPRALKEALHLLRKRGLKKAVYVCFCE